MSAELGRVHDDTRGIVSPGAMLEHVDYRRVEPPEPLDGLLDWFWSVQWDLPEGFVYPQRIVSQPGVNLSIGNPPPPGPNPPPGPYRARGIVNGVGTTTDVRVLSQAGWNFAAKTSTGGFGAWVDDVAVLNDQSVPMVDVLGIDGDAFAERVDADEGFAADIERFAQVLIELLDHRPDERVALARRVASVAAAAEHDRSIQRVEQMAALDGVSVRTLQRAFATCAGVAPTFVIRRFRLLDAAELVRSGDEVDWAHVAAELGYADQAHLTRDFTTFVGSSPAAYAAEQRR